MKIKIYYLISILLILFFTSIQGLYSQSYEPKSTILVYFNNIYGEFSPTEVTYAFSNLVIYLQNKHKIKMIDNGLSSKQISLEVLKRYSLTSYAELSARIVSVRYSNSKFKVDILLNFAFDSIKTDNIDFEKSKNYEGEEAASMSDSKSFTLSNSFIDIFDENIDKVKEILSK